MGATLKPTITNRDDYLEPLNLNVDEINEQHYTCYQYKQSKGSLFRAVISWLLSTILLLIFCIPFIIIISILSVFLPLATYRLLGTYVIIIWSMSLLSTLYILHAMDLYHREIPLFCSIIPVLAVCLFNPAIIVHMQLREKIKSTMFLNSKKNISCIAKCTSTVTQHIGLTALLTFFASIYQIWGVTLQYYKPFGTLTSNKGTHSMDMIMSDCIRQFDLSSDWSFADSFEVYNTAERILALLMMIFGSLYAIVPFIIYGIYAEQYDAWFVVEVLLGFTVNVVIAYAIVTYIEMIFCRLFKYYAYMKRMADLLAIHKYRADDVDSDINDEEQKLNAILNTNQDDSYYAAPSEPQITIYLCDGNNCEIWFENWCRIERLASVYFENRKSNVFAVVASIAFGIGLAIYCEYTAHANGLLTENMVMVYMASCCFVIAFLRLLLSSMRFSDLEKRHIGLIQNQRIFALHRMREQNQRTQSESLSIEYIKGIIEQIEYRSLSPTIAGVSLDVALVKLTVTTCIGFATSAITFALRKLS